MKKDALEKANHLEAPRVPANYHSSMLNNDSINQFARAPSDADPYSL